MNATDRVMQSYGRCCASPAFFDDFYRYFLDSSPAIREKFVNTDMPAQKLLLRQGILNLVMHARGMPDTKLRALGCTHARTAMDIRPELYDLWLESLLATIAHHDPQYDPQTRHAWLDVLRQGIAVIKAQY
ncbi:globin [Pseudomonas daroniae]|uniref:Globin n=1 Tax=Phytopseudomonas daroniae TaxID=2487519 RepID=A0A4Q9QQC3_9GAMM|nr:MULTISPECIES: globin [Pseudomonas]TBU82765.1 globin [Pseudomonas daroniae]TBU86035.1 globin [Pseudomonas sp. FRB 228]TBU95198.1 globin [Pseudomonas daroniae]